MNAATPAEIQRLIADAFDRQGWEFDLTVGRTLVAEIERAGSVDAEALARLLPTVFVERNRTSRSHVASAIAQAIGERRVEREPAPTTLIFADNRRYEVELRRGAQMHNCNLNLGGGTQVNVNVGASKDDVLSAVKVILRAGLNGEWNEDARTSSHLSLRAVTTLMSTTSARSRPRS